MENWAEAVVIQGQFRKRILHAKQLHNSLESLQFLRASMIEILGLTDLRQTFRTMQLLTLQTKSLPKAYVENIDGSEDTFIKV